MRHIIHFTGIFIIIGIFLIGCDAVVDQNNPSISGFPLQDPEPLFSAGPGTVVVVTPDDLQGWVEVNARDDGSSVINGVVPDQYGGNGSLSQSFSDSKGKTDFRLLQEFGPVNELSNLAFDWYRDGNSTAPAHLTPAIGLYVANTSGDSWLLKWEGTYNAYPTTGSGAPTDTWVTENILEQKFWRIPQFQGGSWVGFSGCNVSGDPHGCYVFNRKLSDNWLDDYDVVGIEVGIGSGWNGTFQSYADYVTVNDITFDFETLLSPNEMKQSVIDALQAMLPSGDDKLDKRIEKAIDRLLKGMNPEWWIDDETLDEKDGKKVFDQEKKVVKELSKKQFADNPDAAYLIQVILDADRALAVKAIADAEAIEGKDKDIEKAEKELEKGDEERAKGKYEQAVEKYKKAWENAQKAIKKAK